MGYSVVMHSDSLIVVFWNISIREMAKQIWSEWSCSQGQYLAGSLVNESDETEMFEIDSLGNWSGMNRIAAGWLLAVIIESSRTAESCLSCYHLKNV